MPLYQFRDGPRERTFLFIHIPKTGGTAIETYFRGIGLTSFLDPTSYAMFRPYLSLAPTHFDYRVASMLFRLESLYSFAVVRHPVQRLISEYKWAVEKSTLPDAIKTLSFSDFIRHMFAAYGRDENLLAGHFKPQARFVGSKVSKVFKYEAGLDAAVRQVLQAVGLKVDGEIRLPVVNRAGEKNVEPTEEDIALIRDVYSEDFETFGYREGNTES
jgi:hypothetical protein